MNRSPLSWTDPGWTVAQGGWPVRRGLLAEQSRPHANDLWTLAGYVPSLDLRFAETKSLRDQVTGQNLVSFGRSSAGTFVDAGGIIRSAATNEPRFDHDPATGRCLGLLVEEARTNRFNSSLFRGSWTTFNSPVVTYNAGMAPDGTYTAVLLTCNTSYENHLNYIISGSSNTVSVFAKKGTKNSLDIVDNSSNFYCRINMNTWTVSLQQNCTVSIKRYPDDWYQIIAANISAVNNYVKIGTYATSEAGSVFLWGAQMEAGSFPTSYIPTPATFTSRASTATFYDANGIIQTAATNVARSNAFFPDSNGVMVPAGLLLEAAATNDHFFSNTFSNSGTGGANPKWQDFVNVTLEQQQYSDPAGGNTATRIIPTATSGEHYVGRYSVYNPVTYVHSLFIKPRGYTRLLINSNGTPYYVNLTANPPSISGSGNTITVLPNGWFRIAWLVFYAGGGANTTQPRINVLDNSGSSTFTGDGVSGIDVYGFQRETGTYPTSYIPTAGSAVTRAADVSSSATVTRSADVAQINTLNTNVRSLFARARGPASGVRGIIGLDDNSASNRVELYTNNTDPKFTLTAADTIVSDLDGGTVAANVEARIAARFAFNNGAISLNGNPEVTSNSGALPSVNRLRIGALQAGNTFNGTLARLTTWDQSLTSLPNITRPS